MNKRRLAIILASIAVIALIGGTYAAFTATSDPISKTVSTTKLKIDIEQSGDETKNYTIVNDSIEYTNMSAGEEINSPVRIINSENTPCYVRVTIYREWFKGQDKQTDTEKVNPAEIAVKTQSTDWIIKEDTEDPEVLYCYYKTPVDGKDATTNVMDQLMVLEGGQNKNTNAYADLSAQLTFEADAIQTGSVEKAMLAAWGVTASFDGDTLIDVAEQ